MLIIQKANHQYKKKTSSVFVCTYAKSSMI